jgi:hypothetical protein
MMIVIGGHDAESRCEFATDSGRHGLLLLVLEIAGGDGSEGLELLSLSDTTEGG